MYKLSIRKHIYINLSYDGLELSGKTWNFLHFWDYCVSGKIVVAQVDFSSRLADNNISFLDFGSGFLCFFFGSSNCLFWLRIEFKKFLRSRTETLPTSWLDYSFTMADESFWPFSFVYNILIVWLEATRLSFQSTHNWQNVISLYKSSKTFRLLQNQNCVQAHFD